jgi:hypothetical protein
MKLMHLCALLLACQVAIGASAQDKGSAAPEAGYQLGERLPQAKTTTSRAGHKEITWEALIPKGWDPASTFKDMDLSKLDDGDPRAMEMLDRMREAWDNAPVEASLNGARVRIPGFIVPLETQRGKVTEFLLVPYFGACIHSPPPPANQTIQVFAAKPVKDGGTMSAVWVNGTLETTAATTVFGKAGYRMKADSVTPYKE